MTIPISLYLFLIIQLAAVSYVDLKTKKISNIWFVLNVSVFLCLYFLFDGLYEITFVTFFYSIIFFIVGLFFFSIKIMGAGDSKYLVSFFILVPVRFQESALMNLLEATIIIGTIHFIFNSFKERKKIKRVFIEKKITLLRECYGKKFPFAPVILVSWMLFGWRNYEMLK